VSEFSDEIVSAVRVAVYRRFGVSKSSESGAMLEAVLDGAVRPLCDTITKHETITAAKLDRNDEVIAAMCQPPGAMLPGPGPRRHEDFRPEEWPTRRTRTGDRYE
jgi:hypothetical protein